jgi:hypothetical protein
LAASRATAGLAVLRWPDLDADAFDGAVAEALARVRPAMPNGLSVTVPTRRRKRYLLLCEAFVFFCWAVVQRERERERQKARVVMF